MSKIIKTQIKRSLPWFLILCLFSTLVMGAAFNYNIEFKNLKGIGFSSPEAKADTASTTVRVKNAAPSFSGTPYEVISSTSTTPVNVGGNISFTGKGNDPEGANFYLIICSTNSVTPNMGAAPVCNGGTQFCVSSATANNTDATCNYAPVAQALPESQQWYAFVCDEHGSDPACNTTGSQGIGPNDVASSSPFYVNHGPAFTAATSTIDYVAPGGVVTISASSTDADTARGGDQVTMYVCSSAAWTATSGCAVTTYCTSTPSASDPSCTYTTAVPLRDQAYQYYVFIKDNLDLASPFGVRSSYYHVINVAPAVGNIIINGGADVTLNIKGAANKTVTATSTITDNNTCLDLTMTATGTMYFSTTTDGYLCSANDNICYQITSANCTVSNCVGAVADVSCTASLAFHARPSDDSTGNPYSGGNWLFAIRGFDDNTASGVGTSTTGIEVISAAALDVPQTAIAYGNIRSSFDSGTTTASTTIVNYGNVPMDSQVRVGDMASTSGTQNIYCNFQKYASTTFDYASTTMFKMPGASTTDVAVGLSIAKPTDSTNVEAQVFWGIGIPAYVPSGDYAGFNTFSAILKSTGSWN